jgi:hypothetical protein
MVTAQAEQVTETGEYRNAYNSSFDNFALSPMQ